MIGPLERAARGFEAVVARRVDGFCCPICVRELAAGCATRGHYPAEAVGGRRWALACKACNNTIGTAHEGDAERWFAGAPPDVRLATGRVRGVRVKVDPPGNPFAGDAPIALTIQGETDEHLQQLVAEGIGKGRPLKLTFRDLAPDRVRRAVLSWAFLALFDEYGYAFALEPAQRSVRRAMLSPSFDIPPTIMLIRHPPAPDSLGVISLVMAFDGNPANVRLLGLGVDFGRAVGVVPIATDATSSAYRDLEHIVVNETEWELLIAPIEAVVHDGPFGNFEAGSAVPSPPHLIVGVERSTATRELVDGRITPARRAGRQRRGSPVPERPPGELPHALTNEEWERVSASGDYGPRYVDDLLRAAVRDEKLDPANDVPESEVLAEVYRIRARFQPGSRPEIGYRGQLIRRDGRERAWLWGAIVWPDGRETALGPVFTHAALIEEIRRGVAGV